MSPIVDRGITDRLLTYDSTGFHHLRVLADFAGHALQTQDSLSILNKSWTVAHQLFWSLGYMLVFIP